MKIKLSTSATKESFTIEYNLYKGAQRMEFHRFSSRLLFEDEERSERLTGGREDMKVSRE